MLLRPLCFGAHHQEILRRSTIKKMKKKMSKEIFLALLDANTSSTRRLKPVILGKAAKPRALKDCMHELPVVYYKTKNASFTNTILGVWFFKHFVPDVQH